MDPMDAIRVTFFEECSELLEALEAGLLALQAGTQDGDTIDAVFRAVHSIKGGAGAFDLRGLVAYSHDFETALDALRTGEIAPSADVVAVLLRACDKLGDVVSAARSGDPGAPPDTANLRRLVTNTPTSGLGAKTTVVATDTQKDRAAIAADGPATVDRTMPRKRAWIISFEPLPDLLTSGNEPLFMFRALEVMGSLNVEAVDADLPLLEDMDVMVPRLRWRIRLIPSAPDLTETEIEAAFEFAVNLCVLDISAEAPDARRETFGAKDYCLSVSSDVTFAGPRPTLHLSPDQVLSSVEQKSASTVPATIRVDLERVDRLVNLVGELVISQSMLVQGLCRVRLDRDPDVAATLDGLQQLTRDMQDSVMAIRAQPVRSLFQRMTRIVREAAQATGKEVVLKTEGEMTEIDKTVVERLAEPLTHMIRNAIDHGIEPPEARIAAGKTRSGVVTLRARQQSDRVIIEVTDDGHGIDRSRVLKRAVKRGLVSDGEALEDSEIDRLLFLPGFSTSETVSALSGRGVGMDVVQRAIRDLAGSIAITSMAGNGTAISLSLPLTLAILDGMIVRSHNQRMVIPLSAILETQTFTSAHVEVLGAGQSVVRYHGRYVPLVDLARGMGFASAADHREDEDTALLFVKPDDCVPFALRVDAIEAQRQVVIKGIGENLGHIPCVSAATILGDGQVALIVDPGGIASISGINGAARAARQEEMYVR